MSADQPRTKADRPRPANDDNMAAIARGLGQFRVMSEHDHRLELERRLRRG